MSDQSDAMLTLAKACVWACMTGNGIRMWDR